MFDAPRCREWTPLATQQLRLRSLIQIVGYNIRPPERQPPLATSACSFYYTLHATCMSAPFYTSERISSPHPKWRELRADVTQRNASTNVVIRIWCHLQTQDTSRTPPVSDIIIQTWGVYFSGLRLIGANLALDFTSDSFKTNTLVFQMHGGYFCSYKSLNLEVIPSENLYELNSVSSGSSGKIESQQIPIEANYLQNHRIIKEARSISPSKRSYRSDADYSKSHSPPERGFKQSFAKLKPSASLNIAQRRERMETEIYEHSPDNLEVKVFTMSDLNCDNSRNASKEDLYRSDIDLSESAETLDLRREDGIPKCRYLSLKFLKSEIRPSYNSCNLQNLHLLQYSIKKRKESVKEIKDRIYKKSAMENVDDAPSIDDQIVNPKLRRSERNLFSPDVEDRLGDNSKCPNRTKASKTEDAPPPNGARLTLKLNDLLSYKSRPSPHQRSEYARMTRQLEILRFKRTILLDERDGKLANIRRLKERHGRLFEENQDLGSELMQGYHTLSRRVEQLRAARQSAAAMRELVARAQAALAARRTKLLAELQDIFYIDCTENTWTICNVALPIIGDEEQRRSSSASDAVAAGYAAHACSVAAALLSQPLRYPILAYGSATEIIDNLQPMLPCPQIPLYGDATLFRYGMFLLNKCCAQLLWGCGLVAPDARPTLANLRRLLTAGVVARDCLMDTSRHSGAYGAMESCPHSQSLRSLVASERGKRRQFNRFKDAVDGHSPGAACGLWRHRHSRSVGSYHDDREMRNMDLSTTSVMGSEPFLHDQTEDLSKRFLKQHNSDSQLSVRVSPDQKVVFTLGDDARDGIGDDIRDDTKDDIREDTKDGIRDDTGDGIRDDTGDGIRDEVRDDIRNDVTPLLVKISTNNGDGCEQCIDEMKKICSEIDDWAEGQKSPCVVNNINFLDSCASEREIEERTWSRFGVTQNETNENVGCSGNGTELVESECEDSEIVDERVENAEASH